MEIDPETVEGDYNESYQHISKMWKEAKVDNVKTSDFFKNHTTPEWEKFKQSILDKIKFQDNET